MSLYVTNCFFRDYFTYHSITFCKFSDFRCPVHKVKIYFTSFAIVVYLIQIDCGGDFFFLSGNVFAF